MSSPYARAALTRIEVELRTLLDRQDAATGDEAVRLAARVTELLERQERLLNGESDGSDERRVERELARRGLASSSSGSSSSSERAQLAREMNLVSLGGDDDDDGEPSSIDDLERDVHAKRARVESLNRNRPSFDDLRRIDESNAVLAVAAIESPAVRRALQSASRFAEVDVAMTRDSITWARIDLHTRHGDDQSLADWAQLDARDALYRYLFFGTQANTAWRLTPEWWRLVFCDVSPRRTVLALGVRSSLRWPMSDNGADYHAHRLGFRATGQDDVLFPAPDVRHSAELGRRFVHQTDGNLCAMHAFNNVARSLLLTPPTFYSAVFDVSNPHIIGEDDTLEWFRNRVNAGGTDGDLATAALRRGVLLGRVIVRNIFDIEALSGSPLEALARRNGGVVLLAPRGGHYVPVLPVEGGAWVLLNDKSPVMGKGALRASSFANVMRTYYLAKLHIGRLDHNDLESTARRLREQPVVDASSELRILVPLHFVPQLSNEMSSLDRLAHFWARYVVCNTSALLDNVNLPEGDHVLAINYAYARLASVADTGMLCETRRGNLFTQLLAQMETELALNEVAERLARVLLVTPLDEEELRTVIIDARRVLITPRALGLLLDPADACAPLTNREWLRLAALHVVTRNEQMAYSSNALLFLFMNCLFTDHRGSGDVEGRYPAVVRLWTNLHREFVVTGQRTMASEVLPRPRGELPHERAIRLLLFTLPPANDWNFFQYLVLRATTFDRSLWLLSAFIDSAPSSIGLRRPTLGELQPVARLDRIFTEDSGSDALTYVDLLRRHFFLSTVSETRDVDARVRAQTRTHAALFQRPHFIDWFDIIAAPRRLVQPSDQSTESAAAEAVATNKPQLLMRLYGTMSHLDGSFYDRRNVRVDPHDVTLRDTLTTRFDSNTDRVAPTSEPIIRLDEV